MKKYQLLTLLCVLCVLMSACKKYKYWLGNRPMDQPNTIWVSKDGTVTIEVDENKRATGYFIIDGKRTDFYLTARAVTIEVYSIDVLEMTGLHPDDQYEEWAADFTYGDHFTVKVSKTTFFKVGQKITFYRQ